MQNTTRTIAGGLFACLAMTMAPAASMAAGPCTDDIAKLGRQLGSMPGLGAPVSEPSAGQTVGKNTASMSGQAAGMAGGDQQQASRTTRATGGSPGTVGGATGTVSTDSGPSTGNAVASGQIATSAADVRRQSEGKPTMAQQAAQGQSGSNTQGDKVSEAKMDLQQATDLNAKGDATCMDSVNRAKVLIGPS